MKYSILINDKVYPILNIQNETGLNGRESKRFDLEMSHEEAIKTFVDDVDITLIQTSQVITYEPVEVTRTEIDENGEEHTVIDIEQKEVFNDVEEKTDLSDFCIAGRIIDHRNGKITVYMEKTSQKDLLDIIGEKATTKRELTTFMSEIKDLCQAIPDELAIVHKSLFDTWKANREYVTNERVLYNDILYKVLQGHISQSDWTPDVASSLFAKILTDEATNKILEWAQPDSTNPYMIGDKVNYDSQIWVSIVDNNVWEPGVYGWEIVVE